MAKEEKIKEQSDIRLEMATATAGLSLDTSISQVGPGRLTYALNAAIENFDSASTNYQNEPGNEFCLVFPVGYKLIGEHFIPEKSKNILFLANPVTGESEIGYMENGDCQYRTLINAKCLNFSIKNPIPKVVHRITNCTTEIYWTDGVNSRRYLDIENIPYKLTGGTPGCDPVYGNELDCNQLKIQPNFSIPRLKISKIDSVGNLIAGTYQFGVQYSDAVGNELTSYYSITNPTPIADQFITSINTNYNVGKSIVINVLDLDLTGQFQYFNIAVIKTINNIASVELIGTYNIEDATKEITYTGADETVIRLSMLDIFEKFPYYDIAQDVTAVQDVLVWDNLTSVDRINYQSIASEINISWETYKIPANENYADELNATNLRGYMRDEVYAFEIVFLLKNGKQTDGFHIPGRVKRFTEDFPDVPDTNNDFIGEADYYINNVGYKAWWKVYNTGTVTGFTPEYNSSTQSSNYKGSYQYGEFSYWESTEEYPCNTDLWGELSGQKIRHHKFPDVLVSPIIENGKIFYSNDLINISELQMQNDAVFPIGVKINNDEIDSLVQNSELTENQKDDIIGYKIVRGDRGTNKSIVAKGILRNVNKYTRDEEDFYYANYPYNDLETDPFILANNNAWSDISEPWLLTLPASANEEDGIYEYVSPINGKSAKGTIKPGETIEICSISRPSGLIGKEFLIGPGNYDVWELEAIGCAGWGASWFDPFTTDNSIEVYDSQWLAGSSNLGGKDPAIFVKVNVNAVTDCYRSCDSGPFLCPTPKSKKLMDSVDMPIGIISTELKGRRSTLGCQSQKPQKSIKEQQDTGLIYRQIFNSPETSFGQPFLGSVLKLESVLFGKGNSHFVSVKDEAKYKLLSKEAQLDALNSSRDVAALTNDFNAGVMFTMYQSYLTIYVNGITRKNYAMSFNSRANYDYSYPIENNVEGGIKQREIDVTRYLIPGVQSLGLGELSINNWNRESSVFIKTSENREREDSTTTSITPFPFPSNTPSLLTDSGLPSIVDKSRMTIGNSGYCSTPEKQQDVSVVSYYASLKNIVVNQWGQIYSYQTIDTGYQVSINKTGTSVMFGGDVFISRFAFKTKLPFFIDNRVGRPDDSNVFYDELGNIGYPKYWHSARSILEDYLPGPEADNIPMRNLISYKAHNFDCPNTPSEVAPGSGSARTFYDGFFYLFAYGIPNFYCETVYNTDLRQATNNKEGDFWPHVSSGIPDDWLQETNVTIAQDNTYNYNVTYSKQNKENLFTHLPADWKKDLCFTYYPFRAIYSDAATDNSDISINNWLIYRALSFHNFPQNYGALVSLDGIQNKAILARFENKSLLYNNLLTIDTSNPQAAYLGNSRLFDSSPPIDFAETDLGYVGSQNKFLLKIPQGQVTIDSKRGQIFLIQGTQIQDLATFGSGVNRFMTEHLPFEILNHFPEVKIDNNYNGIGLHGVYDSNFERIIITKLDYIPIKAGVFYDNSIQQFYVMNGEIKQEVFFDEKEYFCNKSWTMSFNFNTKSWISFHSYIPNFYIGENNFFYSGMNACCTDGDLIVLAGVLDPVVIIPTTTTTSTTELFPQTTTTTTTLDCIISGGTFIGTDCTIVAGTGYITIPPTTTTTICQRPNNLIEFGLGGGYQVSGSAAVISTGSAIDACNASEFVENNYNPENPSNNVSVIEFIVSATSLNLGSVLYLGQFTDCTQAPDGWYWISDYSIIYVQYGIVQEIYDCDSPVTTTTTTTFNENCIEFYLNNETQITVGYSYTDCNGIFISDAFLVGLEEISICAISGTLDPESGITVSIVGDCNITTTTTTTTDTPITTTTSTTSAQIACNSFVQSGGPGISDYFVTMANPNGGLITFDFNAQSIPDKLEIIHMLPSNVFIKKATSSMDANNNSSSFDNVYGTRTSNVIPSGNLGSINQFIGSSKGSIPTRYNEFVAATGVTNLPFTSGSQQRIWWVYSAADYANSNQVNIRVTGDNGTQWDFNRVCEIP